LPVTAAFFSGIRRQARGLLLAPSPFLMKGTLFCLGPSWTAGAGAHPIGFSRGSLFFPFPPTTRTPGPPLGGRQVHSSAFHGMVSILNRSFPDPPFSSQFHRWSFAVFSLKVSPVVESGPSFPLAFSFSGLDHLPLNSPFTDGFRSTFFRKPEVPLVPVLFPLPPQLSDVPLSVEPARKRSHLRRLPTPPAPPFFLMILGFFAFGW